VDVLFTPTKYYRTLKSGEKYHFLFSSKPYETLINQRFSILTVLIESSPLKERKLSFLFEIKKFLLIDSDLSK